jgi:hypothetical protein
MLRLATALYIRTGTFSSPKLMEPDQIALAMAGIVPVFALAVLNDGTSGHEVAPFLDSIRDPAAAPHPDRDDPRLDRRFLDSTSAVGEAKEQPLGVPDVDEVGTAEAPRIAAASADASTSAFHLGALLAGILMIIGGVAAGVGIRNPRRPQNAGKDAESAEKLDLAANG